MAGLAGALVVLVARPIVLQVMTLTPTAQGYLSTMMFIMAYFVVAQAYNTTMVVGIFRAGGDTRFGLVLDVVTMWGLLHFIWRHRGVCVPLERGVGLRAAAER